MTFSAGPKTGDHRQVEEKRIPSIMDILIDQTGKMKKLCFNFVVTPRNFIIAKLSIRKPGSSSVLI